MQRKGTFTVVPNYSRTFKIQPSTNKKSYDITPYIFGIAFIILLSALPRYVSYENQLDKAKLQVDQIKNKNTFNFLIKSGKELLQAHNLSGAYSEFKLALAILPDNTEAQSYAFETLSLLCNDYRLNCDELDKLDKLELQ
ncbi:hypothetical protein Q2T40_11195 [Winogradskyella maritima]|uniref:Tetratricopeptide repeat protein n=1 Tax=Winogradskyella maritima TaxID=1517766 RepID=A0ABV8ALP6_9FLAO|nr:hypothetical protein [Winogradskyella maritima]